jgi:hypothetical protein
MTEITNEQIQALFARGEEEGCVNLSHLNELVAEHELSDDEVARISGLDRSKRTGPDPDKFNPGV